MAESCGNPAADADALMPRKSKFDRSDKCVKCKEARGNLVVRHVVYCKDCFSGQLEARFRKTLEPHINHAPSGPRRGTLKPAGDLLIGFSGSAGSSVLLDLVHGTYIAQKAAPEEGKGGKEHPRKDRVWHNVRAAYVEIADAFPDGKMRDRTQDMRDAVAAYDGVDFVPLRIQDAFDPDWWARVTGNHADDALVDLSDEELPILPPSDSSSTPLANLRTFLANLPTPTAVQSAISSIVRVLFLHTAYATSSSHLVLGTSLTSLSISLISTISQGGGFAVPQSALEEWYPNFCRDPVEETEAPNGKTKKKPWRREVRVLRPLREVGMKECSAWARWHDVSVVGKASLPIANAHTATIGGLTKDFIVGLEKDFPSTVSTIAKTTAKLAPKGTSSARCALCELPMQPGVQEWKARISIRSRSDGAAVAADAPEIRSLAPLLCYACHTTLTSRSSRSAAPNKSGAESKNPVVNLPMWTSACAQLESGPAEQWLGTPEESSPSSQEVWETKRMDRQNMRSALGQFLLDP
ncbi:hypothetical protein PENSPDRAFT_754241 [Peniophora sp. CONT]|nr:hypothetical protein PENSPDRAFT_754241 [Peniophora sp. CONT]